MNDVLLYVGVVCCAIAGFLWAVPVGFAAVGVGSLWASRALTVQKRAASPERERVSR